jgi:O-antigen/teichoic acid export membrane protein
MMLGSSALVGLVIITALTWPLNTFIKILGNWLRYQRRAWNTITFSLVSSLLTIGLTILFVLTLHWGLIGVYWGSLIAEIVMSIVAAIILRDWISPGHISFSLLKAMFAFALPLVPASIAGWVTASADRFILKAYTTTAQIGLYSLSASLASGMSLIIGAVQMAWGPFAFSIVKEPGAHQVYSKVFSLYFWLGCAAATALTIFSPLILSILTNSQYAGAATSVAWLAFSTLAIGATYIAALSCGIAKKSVPSSISIFIGAVVNTAFNYLLIPHLGRNGAAIATLIAYSTATIYLFVVGQKLYPIPYRFKDAFYCFTFAWVLIGVDHFFLPPLGIWPFLARLGLCLLILLALCALNKSVLSSLKYSAFCLVMSIKYGPG